MSNRTLTDVVSSKAILGKGLVKWGSFAMRYTRFALEGDRAGSLRLGQPSSGCDGDGARQNRTSECRPLFLLANARWGDGC